MDDVIQYIGKMEHLDKGTQFILETAAVVHGIGIKVCEEKMVHVVEHCREMKFNV